MFLVHVFPFVFVLISFALGCLVCKYFVLLFYDAEISVFHRSIFLTINWLWMIKPVMLWPSMNSVCSMNSSIFVENWMNITLSGETDVQLSSHLFFLQNPYFEFVRWYCRYAILTKRLELRFIFNQAKDYNSPLYGHLQLSRTPFSSFSRVNLCNLHSAL